MAIQNQPGFIPAPFANSGTKNVIPETMPTPSASAAASWTDGFPTVCSLPLASGGIPPARADFNGLFNSITQAQAFYQSGGVYEWDATVDYGTNRMVLGSDGKLYWSMAQSGPNTGAGAVDPTTDDGTYWGSVPMNAPGLGDKSDKVATTEWVKNLAVAPVYVDPAGSDTNDGMSATSAVQTFAKAIQIASALPQNKIKIIAAAGAYTGNIELDGDLNCEITLQGAISVSGDVFVKNNSRLTVSGSYQLSVLGVLGVTESSVFYSSYSVSITSQNSNYVCLYVSSTSVFSGTDVSIVSNGNPSEIVSIELNSYFYASGDISITGTAGTRGVSVRNQSVFYLRGNITIGNIGESGWTIGCLYSSWFVCQGDVDIYGGQSSNPVYIQRLSGIQVEGLTKIRTAWWSIACIDGSYGYFYKLDLSFQHGATSAIDVMGGSLVYVINSLRISGAFSSRVVYSNMNSVFQLHGSATVTNDATGSRYFAATGGQILVSGAGANRLPGSAAGSVDSTSFGYYG